MSPSNQQPNEQNFGQLFQNDYTCVDILISLIFSGLTFRNLLRTVGFIPPRPASLCFGTDSCKYVDVFISHVFRSALLWNLFDKGEIGSPNSLGEPIFGSGVISG
jgi:hypothetical protein